MNSVRTLVVTSTGVRRTRLFGESRISTPILFLPSLMQIQTAAMIASRFNMCLDVLQLGDLVEPKMLS